MPGQGEKNLAGHPPTTVKEQALTEYIHVVGIDPGLVHTGAVRFLFRPALKEVDIHHAAFSGTRAEPVRDWVHDGAYRVRPQVFIEGYRPRSHFAGDQKMVTAVNEMRKMTGGMALLNEGVKKVIRPELMRLLDVWSFSTATHHQDLRSAARIALYGMVKTPWMNQVLADLVRDHLEGDTWKVSACS